MGNLLFDRPPQELKPPVEEPAQGSRGEAQLHLDRVVVGAVDVSKREGKTVFLGEGLKDDADFFAGFGAAGVLAFGRRGSVERLLAGSRGRPSAHGPGAADGV